MPSLRDRFKNAFNAFKAREDNPLLDYSLALGPGYSFRPDRFRLSTNNERSIVTAIYNLISLDVCSLDFRHVRVDEDEQYVETINSGLNTCLSLSANIDQTGRSFLQDVILSMFDEGSVAIIPVITSSNPATGAYDVYSLRVGKIVQWHPRTVRVEVYNERSGNKEQIYVEKANAAIVENPLYSIMNSPNSTHTRLISKLNLLDAIDSSGFGKLDLIIQLPYLVRSEARKQEAERRRKLIEDQLSSSKYGVAYTDGTEHITQLNRPAENNLMGQIEFLTRMLYSQLGVSQAIFDCTADEKAMLVYYNRTIIPVATSILDSMNRTFITPTARTQGQRIIAIKDPFRMVPTGDMGDLADKFTRNAILTSNEMRSVMGFKPSSDPDANSLRNKNLNIQENPPNKETSLDGQDEKIKEEGG